MEAASEKLHLEARFNWLACLWPYKIGVLLTEHVLIGSAYVLANLKYFFAGQNPTFCRIFAGQ